MTLVSTLPAATVPTDVAASAGPADTIANLRPDDPRYGAFAERHAFASLFTSPPWLGALEAAYGFTIEVAALFRRGELAAAIPYCRLDDLRGPRLVAPPFSDYGDPLVEDAQDLDTLLDHLAGHALGLRLRSLRNPLPAAAAGLEPKGEAFWHGIDLARPLDAIWDGLDGSARQNSRKAERSGVTVRIGHELDDLHLFHRMHVQLRKTKYRMLAQPFGLFEAIRDGFGATLPSAEGAGPQSAEGAGPQSAKGAGPQSAQNVAVVIAEAAGEPIAGILLILWQGTAYYKFNASFDTRLRPNDLLTWHAIRYARDRGCGLFDFGISDTDQPGLVRYKRKFATEEKVMRQLVLPSPRPPVPHEMAAGRTLGRLTELLTRPGVPDAVTSEAGDALYRYFA